MRLYIKIILLSSLVLILVGCNDKKITKSQQEIREKKVQQTKKKVEKEEKLEQRSKDMTVEENITPNVPVDESTETAEKQQDEGNFYNQGVIIPAPKNVPSLIYEYISQGNDIGTWLDSHTGLRLFDTGDKLYAVVTEHTNEKGFEVIKNNARYVNVPDHSDLQVYQVLSEEKKTTERKNWEELLKEGADSRSIILSAMNYDQKLYDFYENVVNNPEIGNGAYFINQRDFLIVAYNVGTGEVPDLEEFYTNVKTIGNRIEYNGRIVEYRTVWQNPGIPACGSLYQITNVQ